MKQNRHAEAIPFAERSLAFFEEFGHPHVAISRKALAEWRAVAEGKQPEG